MTPRLTFCAACALLLLATACGDSSGPGGGDGVPADDFPRAATGGDPRGSYTPNAPLLAFFDLPTGVEVRLTRNGGSGSLTLAGSSATEGTYTAAGVRLDVAGTVRAFGVVVPIDLDDFDTSGPVGDGDGTWRAIAGGRLELRGAGEPPDTVGYAADGRGLVLVQADTLSPGEVSTTVIAFRRR
jgi:hypothetical protein